MAVGLSQLPTLYPVRGIRLAAGSAGIKYKDRPDLVVIEIAPGSQAESLPCPLAGPRFGCPCPRLNRRGEQPL